MSFGDVYNFGDLACIHVCMYMYFDGCRANYQIKTTAFLYSVFLVCFFLLCCLFGLFCCALYYLVLCFPFFLHLSVFLVCLFC